MYQVQKPLVIGAPRTGFTLLISVLNNLYNYTFDTVTLKQEILNSVIEVVGYQISENIISGFKDNGITDDLIYNTNFRELAGGPKWIHPDKRNRFCFRKYIGVKGIGDFTLITSHPLEVMNYYKVTHSHSNPELWLNHDHYKNYLKFAAVRNPIATVNSSCFSLNALASEYIQKFIPDEEDNDELRQHLAMYKLTNMDFFEGLIIPLKSYFEEYLNCRRAYQEMKWEELITNPVNTILFLADCFKVHIDEKKAEIIWKIIGFKNLTGHHKHNFRRGHGTVDGWKRTLTNDHLSLFRSCGLEAICKELGYGAITDLDTSMYSPYQNDVSKYIQAGIVYDEYEDRDLFNFAFNKSNLDSSKFDFFKRYEWRANTQIERSSFSDEKLLFRIWDIAENETKSFNRLFSVLLDSDLRDQKTACNQVESAITAPNHIKIKDKLSKDINRKIKTKSSLRHYISNSLRHLSTKFG